MAGVEVTTTDLGEQLARRRLGFGRSPRMGFETDRVEFLGGVRHGVTQGGPIAVRIDNAEWPKWEKVMSADPVDPDELAGLARNEPLTRPRPGHADLAGMQKYGFDEARPVLERASARETAARTALGTVARAFLRQLLGVEVISHVDLDRRRRRARRARCRSPGDLAAIDESPVRAFDPAGDRGDGRRGRGRQGGGRHGRRRHRGDRLRAAARARLARALGPPARLAARRRADGRPGDEGRRDRRRVRPPARRWGSKAHDEIDPAGGVTGVTRRSNRAGGLEGGITNGEPLRARVAMKPISTVPRALSTVDVATGEPAVAIHQRSDVCAVPRAGVVLESVMGLVLAEAALEKFGGDSIAETRRNAEGYLKALQERW